MFSRYSRLMVLAGLAAVLLSCSRGVDLEEENRVLTGFSLTWPGDFFFACLSNEPVTVTIKALDQNGAHFESWSGSVDIELANASVDAAPGTVSLANGIVERSISFDNTSSEDQETGITLSSGNVATDLGVTLLVYTTVAEQPSGFNLAWPSGFDYTCASNEPLGVTIEAIDAAGDVLDWGGSVDIELTNTSISVNPSTVNVSNGSVERSLAFNNVTGQNQEAGIKLSYEEVITELEDTVLVYETVPPFNVGGFTATAWDGQIRLSWTNSPELDFAGVRIMRRTDGPPANAGDGVLVYEGDDEEYVDTGLSNGTTYFYSAFSFDYAPNYSRGVTANGTPAGHTIGSVRSLPGNGKVKLFWDEEGADSYNLYYTDDGTDPDITNYTGLIQNIQDTEYEVTELDNFTQYRFVLTAMKQGLESRESCVIRVIPPGKVIAAGYEHNAVVKENGTVWAWGDNYYGQLGDGTKDDSDIPVQVLDPEYGTGFLNGVIQVAAAGASGAGATATGHTVALKADGTVWAWGQNFYGQLGDGTNGSGTSKETPVQVKDEEGMDTLQGVISVAAGAYHSVALKADGTVWAWGANGSGQLGDGNYGTNSDTPVQVVMELGGDPLTGVAAVSAGENHSVAVKADGTVWTWGSNYYGQLGDGTENGRDTPVQVKDEEGTGTLQGVAAVAAGNWHTVVLKADGTVWAWGYNNHGQLGDGTTGTDKDIPVQVVMELGGDPLTGAAAVAAGVCHTITVKENGTVWAWGANGDGRLGDGTMGTDRDTPVQVKDEEGTGTLQGVAAVAAGAGHTMALKENGAVQAWGANGDGQLGDGTYEDSDTPVQVVLVAGDDPLTGVAAVAAGGVHTMALKDDDGDKTVWAWGRNNNGQLGDGNYGTDKNTPVQVTGGLADIVGVAAGGSHTVALKDDGTVWAWGDNGSGQLGDGTHGDGSDKDTPVQVAGGLLNVVAVAAGDYHTVAVKDVGGVKTVWTWGDNGSGRLGDGTHEDKYTPVQVLMETDPEPDPFTGAVAVAAGGSHTVALKDDGTVWAWGDNSDGQLGDGDMWTDSDTPVQVKDEEGTGTLQGVAAVAAGWHHTVAVDNNGKVWAWGNNYDGQLGDGTHGSENNRYTPVQVVMELGGDPLAGVAAVAAGGGHTIALKGDGTVWTWGDNGSGQLGDGTNVDRYTPVQVIDEEDTTGFLTGVAAVAAGGGHTIALKENGTVWTWGYNYYGQLGDGTHGYGTGKATPVQAGLFYTGWHN